VYVSSERHIALVGTALATRAAQTDPDRPFEALTTYTKLAAQLDPDHVIWPGSRFYGLGQVLGDVSRSEHAQGRPLLSCLVVQAQSGKPGPGFYQMARQLGVQIPQGSETQQWSREVVRVVTYWQDRSPAEEGNGAAVDELRALISQTQEILARAARLAQTLG
jgi:hypothetical protein